MKTIKTLAISIILVTFFSFTVSAQTSCFQATTAKEPISSSEINHLKQMADEEKLAGDVYKTLYETWNLRIFYNISRAEERHQQVVLDMINKYDIDFEAKTERGKYNDPKFEKLYNDLVEQGKKSLIDALTVGAKIEDLDIFDINEALSKDVDSQDISIVFENIRQGSYHHIKAFTNILKRYGETYSPEYLTQQQLDEILTK